MRSSGWKRLAAIVFGSLVIFALMVFGLVPPAAGQTTLPGLSEAKAPALTTPEPWTGDFDKMKERRVVRILVPFSKTIYFLDKGAERGTAAEFARQFETWVNRKYKTRALKIRIVFI